MPITVDQSTIGQNFSASTSSLVLTTTNAVATGATYTNRPRQERK